MIAFDRNFSCQQQCKVKLDITRVSRVQNHHEFILILVLHVLSLTVISQ